MTIQFACGSPWTDSLYAAAGRLMIDRRALISAADELESLAMNLGEQGIEGTVAIASLLTTANGNIAALRRAHRHCRRKVSETWSDDGPLLRAFFYLSAARTQIEQTGS